VTSTVAERTKKVTTTLDDLQDDYLECRDLRHAWRRSSLHDIEVTRNTSGKIIEFTRVITCSRCGTERHTTFQVPSMMIVRNRYAYPSGYMLVGSHSDPSMRVDAGDIRREVFKRVYARIVQ
jgi:hypothetical protein